MRTTPAYQPSRVGRQPGPRARHDQARWPRRHRAAPATKPPDMQKADRHAGAGERHAVLHPATLVGLVRSMRSQGRRHATISIGKRRAYFELDHVLAGRCLCSTPRPAVGRVQRSAGHLPVYKRMWGCSRYSTRRQPLGAVPRRLSHATTSQGGRVDGSGYVTLVAAAEHKSGGGQSPETPSRRPARRGC